MYTSIYRITGLTLVTASALLFAHESLAQTSGPVIVTNSPVYPPPPTFQQRAYADQTARTGSFVTRPGEAYLGVAVAPNVSNAAVVASVAAGSPADLAGIRPGDVITAIGNHRTDTPRGFDVIMRAMSPGAVVDVGVRRGVTTTTKIQLGYAPTGSAVAITPITPPVEQARVNTLRR
jgi:S1-C subfamily serine protease